MQVEVVSQELLDEGEEVNFKEGGRREEEQEGIQKESSSTIQRERFVSAT